MEQKYQEWIDNFVSDPLGHCAELTLEMQKEFPELERVRGHYYCAFWGKREHWWLVDKAGSVVDPSAAQFPSKGLGEYAEWDDSLPEPTGMCPNCGDLVFDGRTCCSDNCHREYAAYCTNPY